MNSVEEAFHHWAVLKARNDALIAVTKKLMQQYDELKGRLLVQASDPLPQRRRRHRRTANQIDRLYKCMVCEKAYGLEGSLLQHCKVKHGAGGSTGEVSPGR